MTRRDWLIIPGDEIETWNVQPKPLTVADFPPEFGKSIRLENRKGRVVAFSENGGAMILPIAKGSTA